MALIGWAYDWPDAADVLNTSFTPLPIPAPYRRALAHAALLHGTARAAAYGQLETALERNVPPFASFGIPSLSEFYSARVGCRVEQPIIGAVDIGTLCVRNG
jgi:hypothetical protein